MATRKKTPARQKPRHGGASSDHEDSSVVITITIGKLEYGPVKKSRKPKKARKATPKQVKAFLKWALTQL